MKKQNQTAKTIEREAKSFEDYANISAADLPKQGKSRGGGGGAGTHFPTLLHLVLTRAEKDGYSHICAWQSHGRCFSVFNRDLFVSEVMPNYFRQSQYASFQRQLNLYGFQRLSQKSLDHGSYYHEMFLRTRADLCQGILRAKEKDMRAIKAAREEPDFHKMKPMPPITDKDIGSVESIVMQQKTGKEDQPKLQCVDDSFSLIKEKGDPLANLFKTIAMSGIDTGDSWMEPRPIAPGQQGGPTNAPLSIVNDVSYRPMDLPKPQALPLPSFLVNNNISQSNSAGAVGNESVLPMIQSTNIQHPEIIRKVSDLSNPIPNCKMDLSGCRPIEADMIMQEKYSEKRPGSEIPERCTKRQADEGSYPKSFAEDETMEEVEGMVTFLQDVDFD